MNFLNKVIKAFKNNFVEQPVRAALSEVYNEADTMHEFERYQAHGSVEGRALVDTLLSLNSNDREIKLLVIGAILAASSDISLKECLAIAKDDGVKL